MMEQENGLLVEQLPVVADEEEDESTRRSRPPCEPTRHRLPETRDSITHKFTIFGRGYDGEPKEYEGYIRVGLYTNGQPGEIFVSFSRMGGRQGALLDAWCTMVSIALQSGTPLEAITRKFRGWGFEPRGWTKHHTIKSCTSPLDYIAQWLQLRFEEEGE